MGCERGISAAVGFCLSICASALPTVAAAALSSEDPIQLEEVSVYGTRAGESLPLGGESITQAEIQRFERDTLDRAILLAPGTSVSLVGPRNETNVWIRGFDRWRVPLYQDGIPVYLPVDNRIDFSRFTTLDVAQVQVSNGFASVIDGPGAMGGSINLVSRVVAKPLEASARIGTRLDNSGGDAGNVAELFAGTRQSNWFAQVAGSYDKQDHFRLSDDFVPGTLQGSGDRLGSYHRDYKVNLKAGYVPSEDSAYSLNYIDQHGIKDNPVPDSTIAQNLLRTVRFWTWPAWNRKSFYWLSQTAIDAAGSYVKVRLYYDKFFNQLDSFDTIDYDTQTSPKSFNSTYDDRAAGGSVELAKNLLGGADTVRVAVHYRWDEHRETESTTNAPGGPWYQQPWETAQENTGSVAAENIWRPASNWRVIAGVSYDWRHLIGDSQWVAQGVTPPFGYSFAYPVANKDALNGEVAVVHDYSASGSFHASYADRARFPTLFEMYSTRFGTFRNNPDLQPERAHYGQIGLSDRLFGTQVSLNAFLARITNAITPVALSPTVSENENIGAARHAGFELELSRRLLPGLSGGMSYSYLARDFLQGGGVPVDTPDSRWFAYLVWTPVESVEIVPNVDIEGRRWLQNALVNTLYYRGGSFTLMNLKAAWRPQSSWKVELGCTNLADRNVVVEDGYHGPGREYFANLRYEF
ncbi:MAG TPA: TonB-dependent receptor [Steroidobacteraceae bacterium]|nr:TonB-dependent receptor [Steroidobacteraceae bacterium]